MAVEKTNSNACGADICCYNLDASVETFLKFAEGAIGNGSPFLQCCTKNCFEEIKDFVGATNYIILRDKGLLEYGTIYGGSLFCKLLVFKDEVNMSINEFMELIDKILDKGLVISCSNDLTTLSSVETYLKYVEAVGVIQQPPA